MPSITREIPHKSPQALKILQELRLRVKYSERQLSDRVDKWREAEEKMIAYLPEREIDRARKVEREAGKPQYTTIVVPYTYAVVMSAHTYLTSVFMGRNPVLQFTARHGEGQQAVQAVEALMDYQLLVGRALPPMYTWLYDALKYGAGVIGLYWEERLQNTTKIEQIDEIDPLLGTPTGKKIKQQTTVQAKTYSGNTLYNIQPYDFLWDVRVPLRDYQKGEYVATRFKKSWNEAIRRKKAGLWMNLEHVSKPQGGTNASLATQGSDQLLRPEVTSTFASDGEVSGFGSDRPQMVTGYEVTIEIIPKEWELSGSDFPEKWVFTCTDDFKTLIGAQPLGAYHAQFPFQVLLLEPEGYGLLNRSMPEVLEPIQHTVDWLVNSHFYNVRAALNNRMVVDPSRVVMKDVLSPLPGGLIRLKPEAYGTDTRLAVSQLAVADVTQNHLRDLQMMFGLGERTVGVNDQIMGMMNSGGRKTATEIRTSTSFGVNRLKTIAEFFSATGFDPLSSMMLQNTQQYYDQERKFKIAGDLAGTAGVKFMDVTPESIAGFYDFVPVDGTLPIDRYAQANYWRELFIQLRQIPEITMQYDMGRMFEWIAQLAGMRNITQFKMQVVPDQQALMMAKMGQLVPAGGTKRASGRPVAGGGNPMEPGQISGIGPTV